MKFCIVDDHALVSSALKTMLELTYDETEVETFANGPDVLAWLPNNADDLDLLILDYHLPGVEGTQLMETIVERYPTLKILMVSGATDSDAMRRILQLGAAGFVPKAMDTDQLMEAVNFVLDGGMYLPRCLLNPKSAGSVPVGMDFDPANEDAVDLTPRQEEILKRLAQGQPIKRIALDLELGEGTIKTHVASLYQRFRAKNRTECIMAARQRGLL